MLSPSNFYLLLIGAIVALAVVGMIFYSAAKNGWMKNGYFRLPSVLLIVLGLFILFQGLGSGVMIAAVGNHIEDHPIAALTINGVAEIIVLLCGTVMISAATKQNLFAIFRLEGFHETPMVAYLLAVPIMLLAQFGGSALSALFQRAWKFFPSIYPSLEHYETADDETMKGLVTAHGTVEFLLIFLFVAIVPALAEEALFRGFAQTNIERSGRWHTRPYIALIIASIFFAMVHGSIFKFPGLLALGLTLGWLTYRTNNLFTGALAHVVNNGFIVIALYLNPEVLSATTKAPLAGSGELSATDALLLLALVIPFMAFFLFLFNRATAQLRARGNAEREFEARVAEDNSFKNEPPINDYLPNHYE
jgi:membrane protease YdiL (CAAX protease family)